MQDFSGPGDPLSQDTFDACVQTIGAANEALWAVLSVETSGCGYQRDRRPKILFERHIFHRLTQGRFDAEDPDVSAPTSGGYGTGGAYQYVRLAAAMQLDEEAALQSASWGLGQILGTNFKAAGYPDVGTMVQAFVRSEDEQLTGMVRFIKTQGMATSLAGKSWTEFARRYNGPSYAKNRYNELLELFCGNYESRGCPDIALRTAQIFLTFLGVAIGGVDGLIGPRTRMALRDYETAQHLPVTEAADAATLDALRRSVLATVREVSAPTEEENDGR